MDGFLVAELVICFNVLSNIKIAIMIVFIVIVVLLSSVEFCLFIFLFHKIY